jgi:HSP20 family protein
MANFLSDVFRRPGTGLMDPFEAMRRDMERMFSDRWPSLAAGFGTSGFAPALDVKTTDKAVEVTAELPGVAEGDIELELHEDLLTLRGEKKSSREEKGEGGAVLTERVYGSFSRTVRLPWAPEPDKVTAKFDKGVLHVSAPKPAEVATRTKRIPIG